MTKSRDPNRVLLIAAYICMLATFATGILWIVAVLIAWRVKRHTEDQTVLAHCQWILFSNMVLILGIVFSVMLILVGVYVFPSDSAASVAGLLVGMVVSFLVPAWYLYRTISGFAKLFRGEPPLRAS